jgi:mannose-1-phosphate guanylyltransferase/mannose-6-phosphate isomerase
VSAPITPLIVCGGSGTRLWPISRDARPKQFLRLLGTRSTFQETVLRTCDPALFNSPVIIANRDHHSIVTNQLEQIGVRQSEVVLEPEQRGSGPAILAGTLKIASKRGHNAVVLALAADHLITDVDGFRRTCREALASAEKGAIVTFGIVPDHPATGYGYIKPDHDRSQSVLTVRAFVEKPDSLVASRYVTQGYMWNSGNFLFRADSLADEYRRCDSGSAVAVGKAMALAKVKSNVVNLDADAFARAAHQSIDHAVMERTARALVVPANHDWADIGSWQALHKLLSKKGPDGSVSPLRGLTINPGHVRTFLPPASRDEYWIVAGGNGRLAIAGEERALQTHDFVLIAAGTVCRIASEGEDDLRVVTVPASILTG